MICGVPLFLETSSWWCDILLERTKLEIISYQVVQFVTKIPPRSLEVTEKPFERVK